MVNLILFFLNTTLTNMTCEFKRFTNLFFLVLGKFDSSIQLIKEIWTRARSSSSSLARPKLGGWASPHRQCASRCWTCIAAKRPVLGERWVRARGPWHTPEGALAHLWTQKSETRLGRGQAGAPADDDHVPWSRPPRRNSGNCSMFQSVGTNQLKGQKIAGISREWMICERTFKVPALK